MFFSPSSSGSSSGGGGLTWSVQTSDFNASSGNGYILDGGAGVVTATLPASPTAGDQIGFSFHDQANACVIDLNGGVLNGVSGNYTGSGSDDYLILVYVDSSTGWLDITANTQGSGAVHTNGLTAGGLITGTRTDDIDKFSMASMTTSADHGALTGARQSAGGASSATDCITMGGYLSSSLTNVDKFSASANTTASSHGSLLNGGVHNAGSWENSTNFFLGGGHNGSTNNTNMEKGEFASVVTHTDHGDLSTATHAGASAESGTEGFLMGGTETTFTDSVKKFSLSSNTTSTSHGTLTKARQTSGGQSDTHGFAMGGYDNDTGVDGSVQNEDVDKMAFSSNTTASSHGTLSTHKQYSAVCNGSDKSFVCGGFRSGTNAYFNVIEYVEHATNTTATDHGDLRASMEHKTGLEA